MATNETAEDRYVNAGGHTFCVPAAWSAVRHSLGPPHASMGGCVAQMVAINTPNQAADPTWLLGMAAWHRIANSRPNRSEHVGAKNAHAQATSFVNFMDPRQAREASYDRFREL
ncbi:hypothetical protein C2857_003630 [Epichloe festucae Fl1]|uniref:Uncharacterized protein n=1 Tax=Epichloe festucae (strain Fl1) TaxID=877507 RepID=A0A7S9KNV9_EPIFF|nr:hypothetical protein C2857_003630 [Epichloe festucae Fl1]